MAFDEFDLLDAIVRAYIQTYGKAKWNSLTEQEQHDAIMCVVRDVYRQL